MKLGAPLYAVASRLLGLILPFWLARRARVGKEDRSRLNERFARRLPPRPAGDLVWLHAASVGESQLLLALAECLRAARPDLEILFTNQTQTGAGLVSARLPAGARHQMAPMDSPAIARRFADHWRPDLAVVAEGEIWPNLLQRVRRNGARTALVNARMTQASRDGWARWPDFSRQVFGGFDRILAADPDTSEALKRLAGKPVAMPGNLKTALPPPGADAREVHALRDGFLAGRRCLLAASTHAGEDALFLDAVHAFSPMPALILAPRHPERGEEIAGLLTARGLSHARRSRGDLPGPQTQVLLANTIGEMGLWYALADAVFLGGASVPGIGGHNPVEPLQLGKPIVTGPHGFNFASMFAELAAAGLIVVADGSAELAKALADRLANPILPQQALDTFRARANEPMTVTLDALMDLLGPERAS